MSVTALVGDSRDRNRVAEFAATLSAQRTVVLSAIRRNMEAAGAFDGLHRAASDDLVEVIDWVFSAFLECVIAGRPFSVAELDRLEQTGRMRARQGATLEILVRSLQSGLRRSLEHLVSVAKDNRQPETVEVLGDIAMSVLELALEAFQAVLRGHAMEGCKRSTHRSQAQGALVDAILAGSSGEEGLRAQAGQLGLARSEESGLIVVVPWSEATSGLYAALASLSRALPGALEGPVRQLPTPHAVAVLPAWSRCSSVKPILHRLARDHEAVLVVATERRLEDLGAVYRRLSTYVHLVPRIADEPQVISQSSFAIYEVIGGTSLESAEAYVREALGGLLASRAPRAQELLATVRALHQAGGYVGATATRLQLHERSVRHRLTAIARATGLDLRSADDLLRATLALHLWQLHRNELPALGDSAWLRRRRRPGSAAG